MAYLRQSLPVMLLICLLSVGHISLGVSAHGSRLDRFLDRDTHEETLRATSGARELLEASAKATASGDSVQTSTKTSSGGQTTGASDSKKAPPGGTVKSESSSSAPDKKHPSPVPKKHPSPVPKKPSPPPCTDIVPPPHKYTCAQQKAYGKCKESWMVSNGYCKKTCGVCHVPPPVHPKPTPKPASASSSAAAKASSKATPSGKTCTKGTSTSGKGSSASAKCD